MTEQTSSEKCITLAELAELIAGDFKGDGRKIIRGAAPFDAASGDDVTLAGDARFLKRLADCRAGAVIVPQGTEGDRAGLIRAANPQAAFTKVLSFFYPLRRSAAGISPQARIGRNLVCGLDAAIAPFAVVGEDVVMGDRADIRSHVVLGDGVVIGDDVTVFPNVTVLERCRIGSRVIIQSGTVIGSDGFGYAPEGKAYRKIPHTGIVQIDDDVEIGAGNTIDRATFGRTWIQRGVKTDNLVHIAHNVTVGEDTVLVAQVGISGSVTVGRHVIMAGQAGIAGHIEIGDDAIVGPRCGVAKSVPSGAVMSGAPEMPHKTWLRVQRVMPQLPDIKKKIDALEKRVQALEEGKSG